MNECKSVMNSPTLVLNRSWIPISITPVRKALTKTIAGMSEILDVNTYELHSFDSWICKKIEDDYKIIKTSRHPINVPEVIVLTEFSQMPMREVRLTRRNLLIRDNYTCQYSGEKISYDSGTIDHVIPRSRGGGTTWENLVMCTKSINAKKADRTPEEANLKLLKKPTRPKWSPIYARFAKLATTNIPESWFKFIDIDGNPFGWVSL
jgi:5-methylcytosine-specific restriction endonuclease McrA